MKPLLSLCQIPRIANKDGWAGGTAKILLPFFGYLFASGATLVSPNSTVPQDHSQTIHSTNMADNFQKDCCTLCLGH